MSTEQKTVEKKKAVRKPRAPASHPPYNEMVVAAITALKERNGSSRQKIIKYIRDHYTVSEGFETHVKLALKRGVTKGTLSQTKGTGASGSFKVVKKETKPAAKKPAAKKAPAKPKTTTKTAKPKKPAAKKAAPAKAAKPKAKKPAEKKKATPKKATTTKPKAKPTKAATPKKPKVKAAPKKQAAAKKPKSPAKKKPAAPKK